MLQNSLKMYKYGSLEAESLTVQSLSDMTDKFVFKSCISILVIYLEFDI